MTRTKSPDPSTPGQPAWTSKLKPAPGDLRIVQAFINTARLEKGTDELQTPAHLANWLSLWRLTPQTLELGEAELERVITLRENLRAAAGANNGGEGGAEAIRELDNEARKTPVVVRLVAGGTARFEPVAGGFDGALGQLLAIVAAGRIAGTWKRFKTCAHEGCRAAFYDLSKNRAGKWCSMQRCGNRLNARRYQRRLRKQLKEYSFRQAMIEKQRRRKLQEQLAAQQAKGREGEREDAAHQQDALDGESAAN